MELVSYKHFGSLRIERFMPQKTVDHIECMESASGLVNRHGSIATNFAAHVDKPSETIEIQLSFNIDCPSEMSRAILAAIRLPIRPGMTASELNDVMGPAEIDLVDSAGDGVIRFVCGTKHLYYIVCLLAKEQGLVELRVLRKDLVDAQEQ